MTSQKPPFRNPPPYDMTEPLCTCGKRPKHKCCEESRVGGKMCLKEYEPVCIPDELLERIRVLRQKAEENKKKVL